MKNGTAKITFEQNLWVVRYANVGSDLRNAPRAFATSQEAVSFCINIGVTAIGWGGAR